MNLNPCRPIKEFAQRVKMRSQQTGLEAAFELWVTAGLGPAERSTRLLLADDKIYSSEGTTEEARLGALHTFSIAKEWFADNGLNLNERVKLRWWYM